MSKVRGRVVLVIAILFLLSYFQLAVAQPFNFETATLGPTNQLSGANLDDWQFVGAKFTVSEPVRVTSVGGHLLAAPNPLFVAINPLNAVTDLPNNTSLSDAIFATTFNGSYPSNEVTIATNFCLPPGRYSIMFGSGLFGATGDGNMPHNNPDIGTPEYFFWQQGIGWINGTIDNVRIFVNGSVDPTCVCDQQLCYQITSIDQSLHTASDSWAVCLNTDGTGSLHSDNLHNNYNLYLFGGGPGWFNTSGSPAIGGNPRWSTWIAYGANESGLLQPIGDGYMLTGEGVRNGNKYTVQGKKVPCTIE
jgi:hypothetical protein